jgi:hypothetical protein
MSGHKGFIYEPVRFDYLARKALPVGILDHCGMKRLDNDLVLDGLTAVQSSSLKANPFEIVFGPASLTDLDSNLLVCEVTIPSIDYTTTKVLAPVLESQTCHKELNRLLGKVWPGLEGPLRVEPPCIVLS